MNRTLPAPDYPDSIPSNSQWLSGEGAGSWFHIEKSNELFRIARYGPAGNLECSGLFYHQSEYNFNTSETYRLIYPCHCKFVNVIQSDTIFTFYQVSML